jgi:hypothetical protein
MTGTLHDRPRAGRRLAALSLVAMLTAACTDGRPTADSGPVAGDLIVALAAHDGDVGAIQFTITGGEIGDVVSANEDHALFVREASDAGTAVVVVGDALEGPLVRLRVPDVRAAHRYRVSIVELADRDSRLAPSVEPYALTVARAER